MLILLIGDKKDENFFGWCKSGTEKMSREGRGERGNEVQQGWKGDHEIRGVQKDKERNKQQCVCVGRGVGKQKREVRERGGGDGRER